MGRLNMDMFPHTNEMSKWRSISFRIPRGVLDVLPILSCHVETVCLLSNRKAASHIKLSLDMDEYYDIMDKKKAEKK